jgi:hypothetical protein
MIFKSIRVGDTMRVSFEFVDMVTSLNDDTYLARVTDIEKNNDGTKTIFMSAPEEVKAFSMARRLLQGIRK